MIKPEKKKSDVANEDPERRRDQSALIEVAEGIRKAAEQMVDATSELSHALKSDRSARRVTMVLLLIVGVISALALYRTEHNANVGSCRSRIAVEVDVTQSAYNRDIGKGQDIQNRLLAATNVSPELEAQLRQELTDNLKDKDTDGRAADAATDRRKHTADLCG